MLAFSSTLHESRRAKVGDVSAGKDGSDDGMSVDDQCTSRRNSVHHCVSIRLQSDM